MIVNLISWEYCEPLLELKAEEKTFTELLIFSCSAEIETYTDRMLKQRQLRELRDGFKQDEIILRQYPVKEITSLKVDKNRDYAEETLIPPDYYSCRIPGENDDKEQKSEIILADGFSFPRGKNNIEIIYTAGYAEDQIPEPIKTATLELVEWTMKRLKNHQIGEVNLKYGNTTKIATKIPDHVLELITPYKRKNW
ncbi:MAG: hypothetical protein JEY99_15175 [Spirochaetales bacterium]|nr:hypothetical protein [Spirochaetales bacterium]